MPEFKNPNQAGGGTQDSRSFLVLILVMFGVIFGAQYWRAQHAPAAPDQAAPPAPSAPASTAPVQPIAAVTTPDATPAIQAAAPATTTVENELYRITFSNRGAAVTSWILKGYKDNDGRPLDIVHASLAKEFGYPLSLYTYDPALTAALSNALYVPSASGNLTSPATFSFDYSANGLTVHKAFSFGDDFVIHASATVLRNGVPVRALLSWPAGFGDMTTLTSYAGALVDTSTAGKDNHLALKNVIGGATLSQPFDFAGVSDQYFAAIFMPDQPADATIVTFHHEVAAKQGSGASIDMNQAFPTLQGRVAPKGLVALPIIGTAVGDLSGHNSVRLFVGPKSLKVLNSIKTANGETLGPVLDFGFWGPISKILFLGLQFVHAHFASNWGWAIVLFTVFINLLLLPLRVKGMQSMLKMQRIQPQIDAIKAKYKNPKPTDPRMAEMNAEVMDLQKANGVSMFGGCIPTLIQLPLLFAFFTMMTRVVELRHAHWFWLPDLSSADPYHILPIVMVLTSFLVQYYTPSPGVDPQQQKMMAFMMPAFSGYMTWSYASGLALYWNVGNLIMIAQQAVMNRTSLGKEMRAIAAKRAQRKTAIPAGGPKTIQGRR